MNIEDAHRSTLALFLLMVRDADPSFQQVPPEQVQARYTERNADIYQLLSTATRLGLPCGTRLDDGDWPVAYVDLPGFGQVSWHMPPYQGGYDGHTTDEKYRRLSAYVQDHDDRMAAELEAQALADITGRTGHVIHVGGDENTATVHQATAEPARYGPGTDEPIPVPHEPAE